MKRLLTLILAFAVGCAPDVAQNAGPGTLVVIQFDPGALPPNVPTPNDLAINSRTGKIVVPSSATDTPAQREFNEQYLGTLGGFPYESSASVLVSGPLDPASVGPSSVVAIDVTVAKTSPATSQIAVAPTFDAATGTIGIAPPPAGWTRAHQYAIALLAGPDGLRGTGGEPVVGSSSWALASSRSPLVNCPNGDLTSSACTLAVDVIPSTLTDPAARLADQLQKAKALEAIRQGYNGLLGQVEASQHLTRDQIPILWTFTIVDAGEVTFDPVNGIIPFPNDVLRSGGLVSLPNPTTGQPLAASDCAVGASTDPTVTLYCGLNTLDGFSTIAPPISENGTSVGAVAQANINASTLSPSSVGLVALTSTAPAAEQTTPHYTPCLNCLSSPLPSGQPQVSPQQLQWQLGAPLDEKTTYLAWVSGDVKDDTGKGVIANPAFALTRMVNPLVAGGHSTVNIVTDAQAAALEPLRSALQPALDGLEGQGVPRTNLALAWSFTTQSEASDLDRLAAYPAGLPSLPDVPLYVYDASTQYDSVATRAGITNIARNIGKILVGVFVTPVALTGAGGTFDLGAPRMLPVTFTMAIPKAAAPPGGYPVTVFTHGFTRSRGDFLALAGGLADPQLGAAAQVTIATDILLHGDRTSCTGSAAALMQMSDDAACADPTTQKCNEDPLVGRCVARDPTATLRCRPGTADDYQVCGVAGEGACGAAGACEGGDFLRENYALLKTLAPALVPFQRPLISGWNIFSLTNFFSTRDNFRQEVIDLAQLVRLLKSVSPTNLAAQATAAAAVPVSFDTTKLGYVGQSLGGILGTLYNAVSADTTNVVLNVPGGNLPQIIVESLSFTSSARVLIQTLAEQGITVGTPAFDQFIGIIQWVLDPADPANMAWRLTHSVDLGGLSAPNPKRSAFIQFIEGDETVPNVSNLALVMAANRSFLVAPPGFGCAAPLTCYEFTEAGDNFDTTSAPTTQRHGFLLVPPSTTAAGLALTTKAQTQVASFLARGRLP